MIELNWSDYEEQTKKMDADFVTLEQGQFFLKMWMPSRLKPVELSTSKRELGYIGYYKTEDENEAVGVVYMDAGGYTQKEYAQLLKEDDTVSKIQLKRINGLECVCYDIPEEDTSVLAFPTKKGYLLEVSFSPISEECFATKAALIKASIYAQERSVAM